jgi:oligopeptide/dipeptide ABC transporter ATP-binding protein
VALLEVSDLRTWLFLRRGVVRAVDGVSFTISEGETLGLVGESGSGKSMAALSLLRLVPYPGRIVGGSVRFDGVDMLSLPEREMRDYRGRRLSMILQDPLSSLNPVLKIGDQVGEALVIHEGLKGSALKDRVVELLTSVGIPSPEKRLKDYPHQFSGGMRQRLCGAIALACGPQLLIADEPTTSLDVTVQLQYLRLLKDMQRQEGLAILFVTHDFGIVARMCNRVAVMYAGKIVELADVATILRSPKHPYTKALIESVPQMGEKVGRLNSIGGQPPSPIDPPSGCRFHPRCPKSRAVAQREGINGPHPRCKEDGPELLRHHPGQVAACHFPLEDGAIMEGVAQG